MSKTKPAPRRRNLVAKHAPQFHRAASFRDRSKFQRHDKHKGREPFPRPVADSRPGKGLGLAA